jgi:hypothetical protein
MAASQQHVMILAARRESGTEEWFCPTCGRRFLMRWPPAYKKEILDPGDEQVLHVGSTGEQGVGQLGDELAWRRWLNDIGIDWDGSAA